MKNEQERRGEIIRFSDQLTPLQDSAEVLRTDLYDIRKKEQDFREDANDLAMQIADLAKDMGVEITVPQPLSTEFAELELIVDQRCKLPNKTAKVFPALATEEWILSSVAGALAIAIDVILVGTPEIVKIYRGGERFDGSILTEALRKAGKDTDGNLAPILQWLSDKCKVPYDISSAKGIVTPNNHRLRSLGHDPFLGLFFAVADVIMGTTTCVDNDGKLTIMVSNHQATPTQKLLSVFYYVGHIISDLFTARGIPVPGFFLTQFFADGGDDSLARMAERMYQDGYDMRHLASMSSSVAAKNLIIDAYLYMTQEDENRLLPIAERERAELNAKLKREKMLFVASSIASAGNVAKFYINGANPCALNVAQWADMIRESINMTSAATRDRTVETVMDRREEINAAWERLKNGDT